MLTVWRRKTIACRRSRACEISQMDTEHFRPGNRGRSVKNHYVCLHLRKTLGTNCLTFPKRQKREMSSLPALNLTSALIMKRPAIFIGTSVAILAVTAGFAPQTADMSSKQEYRVMSLEDLFEGDDEAMARLGEGSLNSTYSDGSEYHRRDLRRIDMEPKDYEKALNRMAADDWIFEGLTKSNCWIFSKK